MNIFKLLAGGIVLGICLGARSASADEHFAAIVSEEKRLLTVIAEEERSEGIYSPDLYVPLRELGTLLDSTGRHEEAIQAFRRMQHLVHRHFGVLDHKQIESVDFIIKSYAKLGDYKAIDTQQHYRYHLAQKAFTDPDPELTFARLKIADWYRASGRFEQALDWYQESLQNADNLNPADMIRILRSEALTQFLYGKCCASEALLEALEIASDHPNAGADVSQSLNDFLNMVALERGAIEAKYLRSDEPPQFLGLTRRQDVIELMALTMHSGFGDEVYVDFGEREPDAPPVTTVGYPIAMCGTTLNQLTRSNMPGDLEIELTVNQAGQPENIEIVGDTPIKLKRYLKASLKRSMFRSATDNSGEHVSAKLRFKQSFDVHNQGVASGDNVTEWSRMLVSQTCQVQGIQKI